MERDTVTKPCRYHHNADRYPSGECKRCVDERYARQKASGGRKIINLRHNMKRRYGLSLDEEFTVT